MEGIEIKEQIGKIIGKKIRSIRKKKDLDQKTFAELLGVHKDQISRYERGINVPRPDLLKRIAEQGDTSTDYFFDLDQDKPATVKEGEIPYRIVTAKQEKLVNDLLEILDSGDDVTVNALIGNIQAFIEAVHAKKKNGPPKTDD